MSEMVASLDALHRRVDGHHEDLITLKVQHQHLGSQLDRLDTFLRDHMSAEEAGMKAINLRLTNMEQKINRMLYMTAGASSVFVTLLPIIFFLSKNGVI
jgi:hypothetical protein